jgi:hypothetical protein
MSETAKQEIPSFQDRTAVERVVRGALRSCIRDHGPITAALITSAAKRIVGNLLNVQNTEPDNRRPSGKFPVITGPAE